MTYLEKLKDPRWQKKRLEILSRDDFTCQHCGNKEKTLHVHHTYYAPGDPWEIEAKCLITLCEDCHELEKENFDFQIRNFISLIRKAGKTSHDLDPIIACVKEKFL